MSLKPGAANRNARQDVDQSRARKRAVAPTYLITFTCYGARIHGSEAGAVDLKNNIFRNPLLAANEWRLGVEQELMRQEEYKLDAPQRGSVLESIRQVCSHRGWNLLAAHVRTTHVHVVVHAVDTPERVMNDFKAYASRALNDLGLDAPGRRRWTRHGSTRYLWDREQVGSAAGYVLFGQGAAMAVFDGRAALDVGAGRTAP